MKRRAENDFEGVVKISNIENNKEKIIEEVNKYIEEHYQKPDLYVLEKETPKRLILNFHTNTEIAGCISRYLKLLQLENPDFSNIKVNLNVSIVNTNSKQQNENEEKSDSIKKNTFTNRCHTLSCEKLNVVLSKSHNFSLNDFNKNGKSRNMKVFESIFLSPGPYRDPYEKLKEENRKNKALWMNKKGFDACVGKETILKNSHFIKNYVNLEPAQKPILNIFRQDEKSKWVGRHNFYV